MYELDNRQEDAILANFKEVIDNQDTSLISEELYNHLNINCNFSSYFGLDSFRVAFAGKDGFWEFAERFDRRSDLSEWVEAPEISRRFSDLNNNMLNYATNKLRGSSPPQ